MPTSLRRALLALIVALSLTSPGGPFFADAFAAGQKTVHVKEYTRKDGTVVRAHDRKAPEAKPSTPSTTPTPSPSNESRRERTTPGSAASVARDANGRIHRSEGARHAFMRQTGYAHGRPGYIIDHIVPLACGGADDPSNMQWQTFAEAKVKDRVERAGCR
jgi:hypothetical protein